MKKFSSILLSVLMIISVLSSCGNKGGKESKNTDTTKTETTTITTAEDPNSMQTEFEEWSDLDEYTTGDITYSVPKSWNHVDSDKDIELYRKFDAQKYTFSVQVQKDNSIDLSMPESDVIEEIKRQYTQLEIDDFNTIKINNIDCIRLLCRDKNEDDDFIKIICQSNIGTVTFNFFDSTDYDYLNKQADCFINTVKNNIDFSKYYSEKSLTNLSLWDGELNEYHIDNMSYKIPKSYGEFEKNNLDDGSVQYVFSSVGGTIQVFEMNLDIDLSKESNAELVIDSFVFGNFKIKDYSTTEDGRLSFRALVDTEGNPKTYIKAAAINTDNHVVFVLIMSYSSYEAAESVFNRFNEYLLIENDRNFSKEESDESNVDESQTVPIGMKNALASAKSYLKYSAFSYNGLIDQIEYEGYTHDEAVYAADNCGADWKEQALKSAKSYLKYSSFSYQGLYDQLIYEQFANDQAKYGVDNCEADWYEQAAKTAQSYLDYSSFSRQELYDQLIYEGFTSDQAQYGLQAVGY